jgi:HAMP domain-containing protein
MLPRRQGGDMGLRAKLNLMLLAVFAIGLGGSAYVSNRVLQKNAREEVLQNARIMIESARGAASYTVKEVRPLLAPQLKRQFLPQAVSFYAARKSFEVLRGTLPDYKYRIPALNPTNPADRATDWEADAIREFRNNPDRTELIAERDTPAGPMLDLFQPVTITDEGCLMCHSHPENAPKTLIDIYGKTNGFGWKMNDTVGAEVTSVPLSVPLERAHTTLMTLMACLAGIFLTLVVLLNVLLHFVIIRPVLQMAQIANEVSLGKPDVSECEAHGADEIASLGRSFNRMRRSLESAMRMLQAR